MLTGWVLFIVFTHPTPQAISKGGPLPVVAATSAVFADKKACNKALDDFNKQYPWTLFLICEPQA